MTEAVEFTSPETGCVPIASVWVVLGSSGQYSDWSQWAVEAHDTEQAAKDRVGSLSAAVRAHEAERPSCPAHEAEDAEWTVFYSAQEAWAVALERIDAGASDQDDNRYSAVEVPFNPATPSTAGISDPSSEIDHESETQP